MFESSSNNRESWNGRQMVWQCIPNNYLKQQMKMIWKLPGGFTWRNALRKTKKSGVLAPVHILGWEMKDIGWLLRLEHFESNRCNFETNSGANRKPMQIRKDGCNVAEPRFLGDNSSKSSGHAEGEPDLKRMCQPGESCRNQIGNQLYCCSYGFRSLDDDQ